MKVKEYLINLWNKIKFDETGQYSWSSPGPNSLLTAWRKNVVAPVFAMTGYNQSPKTYGGSYSPQYTQPKAPTYTYKGGGGSVSPQYTTPIQQQKQTQVTPPKVTQPQTPGYTGGGYTAPSMGEPPAMQAYEPFDWRSLIPQAPAAPQVTAQMIAEWLSRATGEAGLMYDPQAAGIGRELETSLLASEQSKGAIPGYYQDIMEAIKEWQKTTTEEEQRRWYARGLGQGGGLIEAEKGISESALKETTKAETEKARLLTEITQQEELLKKQAGQKTTEIDVARSQYITSRSAELREKYETNQAQISQQQFQNQMQIAQFGFTAESQNFQNYLQQASLSNDTWYKEQLLSLEKESMSLSSAAQAEALQWQKSQAGQAGKMTDYQQANLNEQIRQFNEEMAQRKAENLPGEEPKTFAGLPYATQMSTWLDLMAQYEGNIPSNIQSMLTSGGLFKSPVTTQKTALDELIANWSKNIPAIR